MEPRAFRKAVEADIREHELIAPRGAVTCLVSGGAGLDLSLAHPA